MSIAREPDFSIQWLVPSLSGFFYSLAICALIEQETVRAIVQGYADGRIKLPAVSKDQSNASVRCAPSFRPGTDGAATSRDRHYTTDTLAQFLGWRPYKVEAALAGLALIEQTLARDEQFKGLSTRGSTSATLADCRSIIDVFDLCAAVRR